MRFYVCVLSFALAACSSATVVKPVTVEVPVAVPCRAPEIVKPVFPTAELKPETDLFTATRAFLAENELRQAYEAQLEAAVATCR